MCDSVNCAIPQIKPGDLIKVYDVHQQAWGQPAKSYCVERVDSDGSPVSACGFHHNIKDVVSVHRQQGKDFVCIYERENYEVEPFAKQALDTMSIALWKSLPDKDRDHLEKDIRKFNEEYIDACNRLLTTKINDQITLGDFIVSLDITLRAINFFRKVVSDNGNGETNA